MTDRILVERLAAPEGEIAQVTLHNPGKRNALDPVLLGQLDAAFSALSAAGVRAVVLTGTGASFSAGYDIGALPEAPDDAWLREHGPLGPALRALAVLPVVAALNGPAIGGGLELALSCDLRVAHPEVVLQMPPVRMGLIYTPEGIVRLIRLCGEAQARKMLLCAAQVTGPELRRSGLCQEVVPRGQVLPRAHELALELARGAPLAVRGTKALMERLLRGGATLPEGDAEAVLAERRQAWYSDDAKEARAAFRERRPPRFRGT